MEKQVKNIENFIYSTPTSSTMKEEDFRVLLVTDENTLHASNVLKLSFISSVLDYPVPRGRVILDAFILRLASYK
jgi:hypothetical protein